MNDFTLPGPRPSYRLSVATNDDSALEALPGWHVRLDAELESMHTGGGFLYESIIFQPDEFADAALMRLGIKYPSVVSAIWEAVKESDRSSRMLGLEYAGEHEHIANEDLGKHLFLLISRLQSGIAIIEEQLAADSGGNGPPTKTSSAQPPKENERPSYLGLTVDKGKRTIQRLETGHALTLSGDEWTMFMCGQQSAAFGEEREEDGVWRACS